MSHDLEMINGQAQAMFERVAWHRLGTVVGTAFSWADAIAAGLTITMDVEKMPLDAVLTGLPIGADMSGPTLRSRSERYVNVRADGLIVGDGIGSQGTIFPAYEGWQFGNCITQQAESEGFDANLISLGTLDEGGKWFMTFSLGTYRIGDYEVNDYVVITGSYDGSWCLQLLSGPVLAVCANTVAAAKAAGVTHYKYKHTSGIADRVENAKRALVGHSQNRQAFKALGDQLLTSKLSPADYSALVTALFPTDDKVSTKARNANTSAREQVTALYKAQTQGPDMVSESGNAWAFVQAVNTYENWGTPVRNTGGRTESETRARRQIESVSTGAQALTDKAFALVSAN